MNLVREHIIFEKFVEDSDPIKDMGITGKFLKCKKSLWKSTYMKNAFTRGKIYEIVSEDKTFIHLLSNLKYEFAFSKDKDIIVLGFYNINDYFYYDEVS
jgi:hypothetical protein